MRVILSIIVLAVLMVSCQPPEKITVVHRDERNIIRVIDFAEFTERGFFYSPQAYYDKYDPVAMIDFTFIPAANYKIIDTIFNKYYRDGAVVREWVMEEIDMTKVLDTVAGICRDMGADALVNCSINKEKLDYKYIKAAADNLKVQKINVTGFAIKRKE